MVLEERRMRVDNEPQSLMGEQMQAALHLSHPYGRPVIGWAEEVRRIDRVSAQDFYDHHYAPNNAILVIAGDVTPDEVRKMAQDAYGKVPARDPGAARRIRRAAAPGRNPHDHHPRRRAGADLQPHLSRAVLCPGQRPARPKGWRSMPSCWAATRPRSCIACWWSRRSSRPMSGASYDGYARDAGEFSRLCRAAPRRVAWSSWKRRWIRCWQVNTLALPRDNDLARAKTELVASVTYRRDSQFSLASAYGQALTIGLTVDDVNEWPARIRAVNAESVRKAAQILSRRQAVTAYLIPGGAKVKRLLAILAFCWLRPSLRPAAYAANIQNIDLGKNAEVWFAEDHTVPIISFNISMPAGSAYDPAGQGGAGRLCRRHDR